MGVDLPDSRFDEDTAEHRSLVDAIAVSEADPRTIPHEQMRTWSSKVGDGRFDAEPPVSR